MYAIDRERELRKKKWNWDGNRGPGALRLCEELVIAGLCADRLYIYPLLLVCVEL
jgi:hypothetical protein